MNTKTFDELKEKVDSIERVIEGNDETSYLAGLAERSHLYREASPLRSNDATHLVYQTNSKVFNGHKVLNEYYLDGVRNYHPIEPVQTR